MPEINEQPPLTTPYEKLFLQNSKREAIMIAVARLMTALDKATNPDALRIYSQTLSRFSPDQLTAGFVRAEATLESWVSPAALVRLILEPQMQSDLGWLLYYLARHGTTWEDKAAAFAPSSRDPETGEMRKVQYTGVLKAPEMPTQIHNTLYQLGAGNTDQGLKFMNEHPTFWTASTEAQYQGQRIKLQQEVEKAWRAAWMAVFPL